MFVEEHSTYDREVGEFGLSPAPSFFASVFFFVLCISQPRIDSLAPVSVGEFWPVSPAWRNSLRCHQGQQVTWERGWDLGLGDSGGLDSVFFM